MQGPQKEATTLRPAVIQAPRPEETLRPESVYRSKPDVPADVSTKKQPVEPSTKREDE
ncbi:MAG: hypothetical protein O2807_13450 [bacterium]|nr:hypothetical protein [bacterium]